MLSQPIKKYTDIKKVIRNGLNVMGIFDGEYAYKGPDCVQIDLTNNCNNNCIACWCNSPLLRDKAIPPEVKRQTLDYHVVIALLDRLAAMGTTELYFSGGGEPLMHPRALDILTYAKSRGFDCTLHTNFTLVDEKTIELFKGIHLDDIVVSLWAATAETYVRTHPNKQKDDFERIRKLLILLNKSKHSVPRVRIYNVISNINCGELKQMAEFGLETCAEWVEFTVVDTIPQRTDALLFTQEQTRALLDACRAIKADKRYYHHDGTPRISNFEHFMRRAANEHSNDAEYDRGFLDAMPCYVGWIFARILADGNVNSCLKSHRIPVGNLCTHDFKTIWNGAKQREFRRCVFRPQKESSLLALIGNDPDKKIGCYKSCDDLGRNMFMHDKMLKLTPLERRILKGMAHIRKCGRELLNGKTIR